MIVEARIPTKGKNLRIRHFESMHVLPLEEGFRTIRQRALFLSAFVGQHYNRMLQFKEEEIIKMSDTARTAFARMDVTSELPEKVTLKGQTFCLVDPDKIGIGWHIDFSNCPIAKDPVKLACLFYVQEGYNYSDVDENNNIVYPISSRYELFAEEFPLELFLRSADFFLRKSLKSTKRTLMVKIAAMKMQRRISFLIPHLNPFNGRSRSKQS